MTDARKDAADRLAKALRDSEDKRILLEMQPWDPPEEKVPAPRPGRPEDHAWDLAGTKRDQETPTTYFLWGCRKCGRQVVTEAPSKDAPCTADQSTPDAHDLSRESVDENCLQAMVDGVSRL